MILGLQKERKLIETAIKAEAHVLLVGPTGCGKTSLIHEIANSQTKTLVSIPLNGQIGREELIGKWLLKDGKTFWQNGILVDAIKKDQWVLFDEVNAALPEVLFLLHSLLDHQKKLVLAEKDNEVLEVGKNFRFFSTMNPSGDYAGTKELNLAFTSRFGCVLNFDYPDLKTEVSIINSRFDLKAGLSEKIALYVASLRELHIKGDIFYPVSTRDALSVANLINSGVEIMDALSAAILNKMTREEVLEVKKQTEIIVNTIFKESKKSLIEVLKSVERIEKENKDLRQYIDELKAGANGFGKVLQRVENLTSS